MNLSTPPILAVVAPTGFENELMHELKVRGATFEQRGRLMLVAAIRDSLTGLAWAQNTWLNPVQMDVTSISDAAKKLRALAPFWALHSTANHRRAKLIQEQLPKLKRPPHDFLASIPERPLGSWTLLDETTILASADCASRFPDGEITFNESKLAPSRAYMKLWELFTVDGVRPQAGSKCLELGASPGGWTWVLAGLGCEVIAVDRADLAPDVACMKGVSTLKRNAFTLTHEDTGRIDWLFSDLICYPKDLLALVERWMASGQCRNFVCTLKFRGETDHESAKAFAAIPGSHIRHLSVNKHELTWWLVRDESARLT